MHPSRRRLFVIVCLSAFTLFFMSPVIAAVRQNGVTAAWERARAAGSYQFTSDVVQTRIPRATVNNVGSTNRSNRLYLEGKTDLRAEVMELQLWAGDGSILQDETGAAVRVADGKTLVRQGTGAWKEVGGVTDAVAPDGDFMAYLAAVRDVQSHAPETRAGITFTRHTFQLDGPTFASYIREQMEAGLRQRGELPPGVHLDTPAGYDEMTGTGELWVGRDGLPIRQILNISFPEQQHELTTAEITVDFAQFGAPVIGWLGTGWTAGVAARLLDDPSPLYQLALWTLVVFAVVRFRHTRAMQQAIPVIIIVALIFSPLLTSLKTSSFFEVQTAKAAEQEQQQQASDMELKLNEMQAAAQHNPHANPVVAAQQNVQDMAQQEAMASLDAPAMQTVSATVANDGTDTDGDDLSDYVEELLGTNPSESDTDDDLVDDGKEVRGFGYSNKQWYGNPLNFDSNQDTRGDGQEWFTDANGDSIPDDTDADTVPDLFDDDDDGDAVPDKLDLAPLMYSRPAVGADSHFVENTPFALTINDLEAGKPTYVDFQLRPKKENHLWFAHNVLDWPDDRQAQIQDADQGTWADKAQAEGRAPSPNEAHGDLKLVPMLEIRIAGSSTNLPQQSDLDPYNIFVNDLPNHPAQGQTGKVAYVPLSMVADSESGARVAFNGRMLYMPAASWGSAQQVRLVWLVQALVDQCKQHSDGLCSAYEAYNESQVVQTYYDEWMLTGLNVREDHGTDVAIVYEDPAKDTDVNDDTALWLLASGLDTSFLAGRDADNNGQRDVTIDEIYNRFNNTTNSHNVSDDRYWGIPDTLVVERTSGAHLDLAVKETLEQTTTTLDNTFKSRWSTSNHIKPLLMFAREEQQRSIGLDPGAANDGYVTLNGSSLTVDFLPSGQPRIPLDTVTGLKWSPYCAETGTSGAFESWANCQPDAYWNELEVRHGASAGEQGDDADVARGKLVIAQMLYLSLLNGVRSTVARDNVLVSGMYTQKTDAETATQVRTIGKVGRALIPAMANIIIMAKAVDKVSVWKYLGNMFAGIKDGVRSLAISAYVTLHNKLGKTAALSILGIGVVLVIAAVATGAALLAKYVLAGNAGAQLAAGILLNTVVTALLVVLLALDIKTTVVLIKSLTKAGLSTVQAVGKIKTSMIGTSKAAGVIGAAIGVAVVWGFFIYSMVSNNVSAFSPEFNQALAETIAATILIILLAVLSATVIGLIIVGIITIIDGILTAICELGVDELRKVPGLGGACFTLGTAATKVIAKAIYSFDLMVDTDRKELVTIGELDVQRADPNKGFTPNNPLQVTLPVTTTIVHKDPTPENWTHIVPYIWFYSKDNLRSSTFRYSVSREAQEVNVDRGEMENDWKNVREDHKFAASSMYTGQARSDPTLSGVSLAPGVNQKLDFNLNMGYAVPAYECWSTGLLTTVCYKRTIDGNNSNYVDALKFDILPNTLDEFMALADKGNGASRLAWDTNFPALQDADGDGLRSIAFNGLDTNDTTHDADGDGISDGMEAEKRAAGRAFSPGTWDTDGDTLSDAQELQFGTDPNRGDSDRDGLNDNLEVWHPVYSFDTTMQRVKPTNAWTGGWAVHVRDAAKPGGRTETVTTRVSSNPLVADTDADGLNDAVEKALAESVDVADRVDDNGVPYNPVVANLSPLTVAVGSNDQDGVVKPGDALAYTTTVDTHGVPMAAGVLEVNVPTQLGGGTQRSILNLPNNPTTTVTTNLTVNSGASSGGALLSSVARARLQASGVAGFEWQPIQTEAAIGSGMTTPARGMDATASRPDRQDSFLLSSLTSTRSYAEGQGDIRVDSRVDAYAGLAESDASNVSFLRGAAAPSIANAGNGNSMVVWDHYDNCNTINIGTLTVKRDENDHGTSGIEPVVFINGVARHYAGQDLDPGDTSNAGITNETYCGDLTLQIKEWDGGSTFSQIGHTETFDPHDYTDRTVAFSGDCADDDCNAVWLHVSIPQKHNYDVAGAIIGPDTTVVKSQFSLSDVQPTEALFLHDFHPVVASDGSNFLVVWEKVRVEQGDDLDGEVPITKLVARRFDSSGNALTSEQTIDEIKTTIRSGTRKSYRDLALVWSGNHYRVAWKIEQSGEIKTQNIAADGTVSTTAAATATTAAATTAAGGPQLAYNPVSNNTMLVYGAAGGGIRGRLFEDAGAAGSEIALSTVTTTGYPRVAYHPVTRGWLVTWTNDSRYELEYSARKADGTALFTPASNVYTWSDPNAAGATAPTNSQASALACPAVTSVPAVELRFEEQPGATIFADSSGNNRNATTVNSSTSPATGAITIGDGATPFSDYAADFDGVNDYATVPYAPANDFSVSFWFKSNQTTPAQFVLANDWVIGLTNGRVFFKVGDTTIQTSATIADGNWHFVTATRQQATGALKLYIDRNTTPAAIGTGGTGQLATDELRIGSGAFGNALYDGLLDQLAIYSTVIGSDTVDEIYDRQMQSFCLAAAPGNTGLPWARLKLSERDPRGAGPLTAVADLPLLIDADAPTATISSFTDGAYVKGNAGSATTMIIGGTAADTTSSISKVEVSVNGGAWQVAEGAATWAYGLNVTEGTYNISVRATDVAGNIGAASTAQTLIVDATPPQLVLNPVASNPLVPTRSNKGQWTVALSGTVGDPVIGSQQGSGVDLQSVEVLLQGQQGSPEGNSWQQATVAGGNWSVLYTLPIGLMDSTGSFTVAVRAADVVGNRSADDATRATLHLDARGPAATLAPTSATKTELTGTQPLVISGVITETGNVAGLNTLEATFTPIEQVVQISDTLLLLPFDEAVDATYYVDSSTKLNNASCTTTTCPTAGVAGRVDQALQFDGQTEVGVQHNLSLDFDQSQSFSVQAWIKTSSDGKIVTKQDSTGLGYSLEALGNGRAALVVASSTGLVTVTGGSAITDNLWHHVVGVIDRAAGQAQLYLDRQLVASAPFTGSVANSVDMQIGSGFAGTIDQVAVFGKVLIPSDVAALNDAADAVWFPVALAQSGSGVNTSTWSVTIPQGLEGQYQIDLRGTDQLGNRNITANAWRGVIDTTPARVRLTRAATGASYRDSSTGVRYYELEYNCVAQDRYLSEDEFFCTGAPDVLPTRTFADTPSLQALFPDMTIRDGLLLNYHTWEPSIDGTATVRACDIYDNCTETAPQSAAVENQVNSMAVSAAATGSPSAVIISPSNDSFVASSGTVNVTIVAEAVSLLKEVTLSLDGVVVNTSSFNQKPGVTNNQQTVAVPVSGEGEHTLTAQATDWAGNVQTTLFPIKWTLDSTDPSVSLDTSVLNEASTYQVGSGIMRFHGTASDTGGLAAVQVSVGGGTFADATFDGTTWSTAQSLGSYVEGETFEITVRAIDLAGRSSEASRSLQVDIDPPPSDFVPTPPETTITSGPNSPIYSHRATFAFTGTDTGTGGDVTPADKLKFVCRIDQGSFAPCISPQAFSDIEPGDHTFEVRAIDAQGTRDPSPARFTWKVAAYPFTGFFSPIEVQPAINIAQAGQSVSVKFSLGGNRGSTIFDSGSPSSRLINCATQTPVEVSGSIATGSLQYDTKLKQYNYIWRTDKAWADTCRQLEMRLVDGTVHRISFRLTK